MTILNILKKEAKMKKSLFIIPMIMLLAFTISCKKTAESQKKAFENNVKKANELSFEYPSFAEVIKEQITAAEAVMNEAEAIADEKAKIDKMTIANSLLRTKFIANLDNIRELTRSIRTKSIEIRALNMQYNERVSADQAISNGESVISNSIEKLKSTVNSRSDAEALSGLVLSDLKAAQDNIDRVIKIVKDREAKEKQAADKKVEEKKAEEAKAEAVKQEQNKLIKCDYCGTENLATATNCKNCGAPIKK